MAIDTTGRWWKGTDFDDVVEYIKIITKTGYPAEKVLQSVCLCGNTTFRLEADQIEGCARRTCTKCNRKTFIGDSADYWEEATPEQVASPCGHSVFELGVGFSLRNNGDIKWITVGQRCIQCGVLVSAVDWEINYGRTEHLFSMV